MLQTASFIASAHRPFYYIPLQVLQIHLLGRVQTTRCFTCSYIANIKLQYPQHSSLPPLFHQPFDQRDEHDGKCQYKYLKGQSSDIPILYYFGHVYLNYKFKGYHRKIAFKHELSVLKLGLNRYGAIMHY